MNVREDAKADGNSLKELVPVSAILVALVALFLGSEALANGTMENDGYSGILTLPLAYRTRVVFRKGPFCFRTRDTKPFQDRSVVDSLRSSFSHP